MAGLLLILGLQKSIKNVQKLSKLHKSGRALLEFDFGGNISHTLWARTLLDLPFSRVVGAPTDAPCFYEKWKAVR